MSVLREAGFGLREMDLALRELDLGVNEDRVTKGAANREGYVIFFFFTTGIQRQQRNFDCIIVTKTFKVRNILIIVGEKSLKSK